MMFPVPPPLSPVADLGTPGALKQMQGQELYGALFEESPMAILEEDWTGPKRAVEEVMAGGCEDFDQFLLEHPEFIVDVRRTHRIVDANPAAMQLFGHTDKTLFLAQASKLLPANAESNSRVLRAFANGAQKAEGERLLRATDGSELPILWHTVIPHASGNFSRMLFYAVDVSALKRTEEALSTAQVELAKASRVAMLGEMTTSIAHEINQPLGAIRLFADTADRWLNRPEPSIARAQRSIQQIALNADRVTTIIQRVKNLVRREPPTTEPISMRVAVLEAFSLLGREARHARVSLICEVPLTLPSVQAEPTQLQQALVNLIGNAIQAMALGPLEPRRLEVRAEPTESQQLLTIVEDTGPGFTMTEPGRVFDPFFSTKSDGMGLGLAICKSIVEAHGGKITASQRADGGARFTFTLPLLQPGNVPPSSGPQMHNPNA